jgi:hypothetical protein
MQLDSRITGEMAKTERSLKGRDVSVALPVTKLIII